MKEMAIPIFVIGVLMLVNSFGLQELFRLALPFIMIGLTWKYVFAPAAKAATGGGAPAPHH